MGQQMPGNEDPSIPRPGVCMRVGQHLDRAMLMFVMELPLPIYTLVRPIIFCSNLDLYPYTG